ncbi:MAG: LysR substrate-binding domain-containing protein [Solirubrobacteraceae bacterium]
MATFHASDHRLAAHDELRIADLAGERFISYRQGARLRELLESAARDAGFEPEVKLVSNESRRIRRLIACGLGIAIVPRSDAQGPERELAVARLVEPGLSRDITLGWREGRRLAPAAAEFLGLARSMFAPTHR